MNRIVFNQNVIQNRFENGSKIGTKRQIDFL